MLIHGHEQRLYSSATVAQRCSTSLIKATVQPCTNLL